MTFAPEDHPNVRPFRRNGAVPDFDASPDDADRLDSLGAPIEPAALPSLTIVAASQLAGRQLPERSWLVPDLIPGRQVTMLAGDGGVGKSLLALQLAAAVAAGVDWIGALPSAGPVLYLGAEDELDEMHRRLVGIVAARTLSLTDLGALHLLSLAGEDAVLAVPDSAGLIASTPLWRAVEDKLATLRPCLLVVDNSADVFAGNEISRSQVRQFVGVLRGAAIRFDMAVLLLSHPSLAGISSGSGSSGSTAWNNSVRSRLYLDRPKVEDGAPDPDARVLKVMKANYAAAGAETRLRWKDGVFKLDGAGLSGFDRIATEARADRVFLDLLAKLGSQGRDVSHKRSPSFAPAIFAKEPNNDGVAKPAFEKAMNRLLEAGSIRIETVGPPSRRYSRIVPS